MSQLEATDLDGAPVSPTGSDVVHVAGLWRRATALLVDAACLTPAIVLLGWLAFKVTGIRSPTEIRFESVLELFLEGGSLFYSLLTMAVVIMMIYGFLFIVTTGATPGLRLLRLRVINIYGDAPEWWRVLVRGLGLVAGTALLGLGVVWVGFDREKRGLQDWLAGTYVIRSRGATTAAGNEPV